MNFVTFPSSFILHIGSTAFLEEKKKNQTTNDVTLFLISLPSHNPLTPTVNVKKNPTLNG